MSVYVYASIGRNVGDEPLNDLNWRAFRVSMMLTVARFTQRVLFTSDGAGVYNGMSEDAFVVIAEGPVTDVTGLRAELVQAATVYRQEAIALSIVEPEFIHGEEVSA